MQDFIIKTIHSFFEPPYPSFKVFFKHDSDAYTSLSALEYTVEETSFKIDWGSVEGIDSASFAARYQEIKDAYINNEYARLRAPEYPPMADYLDALVKGDDAAIKAYIDACLAVKEKYPKP